MPKLTAPSIARSFDSKKTAGLAVWLNINYVFFYILYGFDLQAGSSNKQSEFFA